MICRLGCAACCIIPTISSPIPGMPEGKPAGVRCIQLSDENLCLLFGLPTRPYVCHSIPATEDWCGESNAEAFKLIERMESQTI